MKPLLVFCALVAFCVSGTALTHATAEEIGAVDHLLGMQVDAEGVVFQVFSSGCTSKEDFRIARFQRYESDPVQIILIRMQQDPCDQVIPYGTTIRYSYAELGLEKGRRFVVLNPLGPYQ